MRKAYFVLAALILELFVFQNAYSEEEHRTLKLGHPSTRRYVLWRVYTQQPDTNIRMYASVDSVLKENFYIKEKFLFFSKREDVKKLTSNTYYLILATAGCSENEATAGKCFLSIKETPTDYILLDTPENRSFLDKKWNETKVIYNPPSKRPKIKGRDIDM